MSWKLAGCFNLMSGVKIDSLQIIYIFRDLHSYCKSNCTAIFSSLQYIWHFIVKNSGNTALGYWKLKSIEYVFITVWGLNFSALMKVFVSFGHDESVKQPICITSECRLLKTGLDRSSKKSYHRVHFRFLLVYILLINLCNKFCFQEQSRLDLFYLRVIVCVCSVSVCICSVCVCVANTIRWIQQTVA